MGGDGRAETDEEETEEEETDEEETDEEETDKDGTDADGLCPPRPSLLGPSWSVSLRLLPPSVYFANCRNTYGRIPPCR